MIHNMAGLPGHFVDNFQNYQHVHIIHDINDIEKVTGSKIKVSIDGQSNIVNAIEFEPSFTQILTTVGPRTDQVLKVMLKG